MQTDMVRSAIVVAHPDDEVLWLASALDKVDVVIMSFLASPSDRKLGARRRNVIYHYPRINVESVGMDEADCSMYVDWEALHLNEFGVELKDDRARQRYEANFITLSEFLRERLQGARDVYTHNPWGEYGHGEHIQVHRAVMTAQAELGFRVWFSNYVGHFTLRLARELGGQEHFSTIDVSRIDKVLTSRIYREYRNSGCWTWAKPRWPAYQTLICSSRSSEGKPISQLPLTDVTDIQAPLRKWAGRVRRRLLYSHHV